MERKKDLNDKDFTQESASWNPYLWLSKSLRERSVLGFLIEAHAIQACLFGILLCIRAIINIIPQKLRRWMPIPLPSKEGSSSA